jgi:hypothetical protein
MNEAMKSGQGGNLKGVMTRMEFVTVITIEV